MNNKLSNRIFQNYSISHYSTNIFGSHDNINYNLNSRNFINNNNINNINNIDKNINLNNNNNNNNNGELINLSDIFIPSFNRFNEISKILNNEINNYCEITNEDGVDRFENCNKNYNIINSSIGLKYDKWNLTLWGKNIFDAKYATKGYYFNLGIGDAGEQSYKMYGEPAHYGLTIKYTF